MSMVPIGKAVTVGEGTVVTLGSTVALGNCVGNLMGSIVSGDDSVRISLDVPQAEAIITMEM